MVRIVGNILLLSFARVIDCIMRVLRSWIHSSFVYTNERALRANGTGYATDINIKSYTRVYTKNIGNKLKELLCLIPFALSADCKQVYRRVCYIIKNINNGVVKKYVTIVVLNLISVPSYAAITLHITNMQKQAVKEVQVGEPFLLTVVSNDNTTAQEPRIEGLQDLYVKRVGSRLLDINGKRSQEHMYQVRIDKKGYYTFGPAVNPVTGERSSTVGVKAITSVLQQKKPEQSVSSKQTSGVLLRLTTDKESVYVGQKIKTVLSFYAPEDEQLSIEQVTAQDPVNVSASEKLGPKKDQLEINGKKYTSWHWQWDMFAQEPGQLVIPSYVLDYAKHLPLDNYLSSWAAFFGPQYEHKRIYSNALTLQVKPLPPYEKQVQAVGNFTRYSAQIQPAMAQQYEGMVFKLMLEGSGNIEFIEAPDLILPDAFKWYASKQYMRATSADKQQKIFEYIVQGLQPGDWEIPEQKFTFFDAEMSAYKELKTASLLVNITQGSTTQPIANEQSCVMQEETNICQQLLQPQNISTQDTAQPIPLYIFIILVFLPLCGVITLRFHDVFYRYVPYYIPAYVRRRSYNCALKEIKIACQNQRAHELHDIFLRYVAAVTRQTSVTLTTTDIITFFERHALTQETKNDARIFFNQIAEIAYAGSITEASYDVCSHASHWLKELERVLQ